ncbi:MAG: sigma-54 interaction domain-containing protein [Mariprofundaceae bacterium]
MKRLCLLGFPEDLAADLCIQLGRVAPELPVDHQQQFHTDFLEIDAETIFFLLDSNLAMSQTLQIFQHNPTANLVVLATHADAGQASELMRAGAMDYRVMPCPDEIFGIYLSKAQHQADLSVQAEKQCRGDKIFITQDIETRRILDHVALIAPSSASVLVLGESGTGKERLSRYIHNCSDRKDHPFVAINCAAIPEGVLESELFGYEKGAFTGASSSRPGKFEMAHHGTLLLDEITEMPLHMQAKFLRVLQEGEIDRLGGRAPVKVDVRIIATSNRELTMEVQKGKFRQDLFYRLNVVTVRLPALRSRPGDIATLGTHFLDQFSEMYGKPPPHLSSRSLTYLHQHSWPGNARELENCMHRAFLTCTGDSIEVEHMDLERIAQVEEKDSGSIRAGVSIRDMERALIRQTIKHVRGNRTEAAKLLGISIRTLRNKLNDMDDGTLFAANGIQQQQSSINAI